MLSVRIRGPSGETKSSTISASFSLKQLSDHITALFPAIKTEFDVLTGFPPTKITLAEDETIQNHISNQSVLLVMLSSSANLVEPVVKAKRGAAKVLLPKSTPKSAPPSKIVTMKDGSVVQLNKPVPKASTKKRNTGIAGLSAPPTKRGRRARATAGSEGDIADHLVSAVNGASGQRPKALRAVFRNAVTLQYDETEAICRLAAARGGSYSIRDQQSGRVLGSGLSTSMEITYQSSGGIGNRKSHCDRVDILSVEMLKAVLTVALQDREGHGREILKPENMSKCSPRIFWSIIRHFGPNLETGLRLLLPAVPEQDWAFLGNRKRELSEKAKMNALQQEEKLQRLKQKKGLSEVAAIEDTVLSSSAVAAPVEPRITSSSCWQRDFENVLSALDLGDIVPGFWRPSLLTYIANECSSSGGSTSAESPMSVLLSLAAMEWGPPVVARITSIASDTSGAAPLGFAPLSVELLESWVAAAQTLVLAEFWRFICRGSLRLRRAFAAMNFISLRSLRIWRSAPEALLHSLLKVDAFLTRVNVSQGSSASSPSTFSVIDSHLVATIASTTDQFLGWQGWAIDLCDEVDAVEAAARDADDEEDDNCDYIGSSDKACDMAAIQKLGLRVRLDMGGGWWEDGTVVGFMASSESTADGSDEDEGDGELWRVCLDNKQDDPSRFVMKEYCSSGAAATSNSQDVQHCAFAAGELLESQRKRCIDKMVNRLTNDCRIEDLEQAELDEGVVAYVSSLRRI